ncbi:hypothetical protein DFH05DRAFT_1565688 [Lentinula detonsa]|uniref:Uncharacterized protein n=1 Tax=Lentinula detonsa TaxID=2804962 RepID=A0A9W8PBJ4_9AGAR|nr:hypothetical protein DFH05DRAFT_1565688 [Lentinula detonsa]KAJ3989549.1 hypothetical protein F5890DRAFT_1400935 [Lentinula detonsa]
MALAPAPSTSASRGDVTLQPSFFTSSLYVNPFRDDIRTLLHAYHEQYSLSSEKPFALFKKIWRAQGWEWMHFRVFDNRSRDAFLNVSHRLFLERSVKTEAPFTRVVALFGLYTFFSTQLSDSPLPLYSMKHIPIPLGNIDHYSSLLLLPTTLTAEKLLPLQPYVSHILQFLVNSEAFYIFPSSDLGPFNPRQLPREIYVDSISSESALQKSKKAGRPSRRDKAKKAKAALDGIDKWMHKTSVPTPSATDGEDNGAASETPSTMHYLLAQPPMQTLTEYQAHKANMLRTIDFPPADSSCVHFAMEQVSYDVLERLRQLQETEGPRLDTEAPSFAGKERAERAVREMKEKGGAGLLGLLEGAGLEES